MVLHGYTSLESHFVSKQENSDMRRRPAAHAGGLRNGQEASHTRRRPVTCPGDQRYAQEANAMGRWLVTCAGGQWHAPEGSDKCRRAATCAGARLSHNRVLPRRRRRGKPSELVSFFIWSLVWRNRLKFKTTQTELREIT